MTSFERLVASDPQREGAYVPRDLDAMVSRVLSHPYARVLSWRAFKARILAGFTASCAVMAAAIYALAGAGPSLVRLTFAAAAPNFTNAAAAPQKYATTATGTSVAAPRYVAGDLTSASPSLAAFTVTPPSSQRDAVATLASALGVRLGSPKAEATAPGAPPVWRTHGENGKEAVFASVGGVQLWGYLPVLSVGTPSAPGGVAPSASGGLSATALAQRALDIVHALGTFDTGTPVVGTGGTFVRGEPTNVVVPILIGGHWSNLTDGFLLDASGHVISATGAMFALGPPVTYPLISPRAAVSHISEQAGIFAHAVTPLGRLGYVPTGAPLSTGARLSRSSAQYRILVDAQGVGHALPIYQYVGRSANAREVVLDALAIDPRYLIYQVHGSTGP